MKRLKVVGFPRITAATSLALFFLLTASGMYFFVTSSTFLPSPFPDTALASESPGQSIDGVWQLSLPMPGGTKESLLTLTADGDSLSGTMTQPGDPADTHPIYDGVCRNSDFSLAADMGRITYLLKGIHTQHTLSFDMTTTETIPLGDGSRLAGNPGEISGTYLVPVYSPGGIMENHFELAAENGRITGQMYVPVSGSGASPGNMEGALPDMEAPPGGPPAGVPPSGGGGATDGDKRDVNTFQDGSYEGNRISLSTRTAQGSLFHFTGTIEGDIISLTLHVTDQREGLEATRKE